MQQVAAAAVGYKCIIMAAAVVMQARERQIERSLLQSFERFLNNLMGIFFIIIIIVVVVFNALKMSMMEEFMKRRRVQKLKTNFFASI